MSMNNASIEYRSLILIAPVRAWIDIDEPIRITDVQTRTRFRYNVGDPIATLFSLDFFLSEEDAEMDQNPWADADDFISYEFSPEHPEAGEAEETQVGYLTTQALQEIPHDSFYGRIGICQPLSF